MGRVSYPQGLEYGRQSIGPGSFSCFKENLSNKVGNKSPSQYLPTIWRKKLFFREIGYPINPHDLCKRAKFGEVPLYVGDARQGFF